MAYYAYKRVFFRNDFGAEQKRMEEAGEWDDDDAAGYDGVGWCVAETLLEQKDTALAAQAKVARDVQEYCEKLKTENRNLVDTIEAMLKSAGWDGTLEALNAAGTKPSHYIASQLAAAERGE